MRNYNLIPNIVFVFGIFISSTTLYGQNSDCKVLMPGISGSYKGDCKKGLAHGKGIAQGVDHYEGQFSKGLPDGKGIYSWSSGDSYNGEWSKGVKEGKGEMVYKSIRGDSIVKGYWKDDNFAGKEVIVPYTVSRKDNLMSYTIRKVGNGNEVKVKLLLKGQLNNRVEGYSMAFNRGTQFKLGPEYGVQDIYFPFDLKVTYKTSNPISRSWFDVVFECTINEPGRWAITLNN